MMITSDGSHGVGILMKYCQNTGNILAVFWHYSGGSYAVVLFIIFESIVQVNYVLSQTSSYITDL